MNKLDNIQDWYWLRYSDHFNDKSIPPVPYSKVFNTWINTCPFYKDSKQHEKDSPECRYCSFQGDYKTAEREVIEYEKRLKQS